MTPDAPRPSRKRVWFAAALAVTLVAAAFVTFRLASYRRPLEGEVARMSAAGFATTREAWFGEMPPDAENGAPEFLAAIAWLEAQSDGTPRWDVGPFDHTKPDPWTESMTESEWTTLRARLDAAAPFFERVAAALEKPRFRFPPVLDAAGIDTSPEIRHLQFAVRILDGRAASATTPGVRRAALRSLARLGSIPERADLIHAMIREAAWTMACRHARDAVATGALSAAEAREALAPWPRGQRIDEVAAIVRSEIASMPGLYDAVLDGRWPGPPLAPAGAVQRARTLARRVLGRGGGTVSVAGVLTFDRWWETVEPADMAAALRWWTEAAACPSGTHAEILAWGADVERRIPPGAEPLTYQITHVIRTLTRADARTDLARIALAVRERFDATGAWPASLDEVSAAFPDGLPADAATGAPFVYEVGDAFVRIASGATRTEKETDPEEPHDAWLRRQALVWEFAR